MSEQPQPHPLVRERRGLVRTDAPVPTGGARVAIRTGRGRAVRRVVATTALVAVVLVGVPVALSGGGTTAAPVQVATAEPSPTAAEPSRPAVPSDAAGPTTPAPAEPPATAAAPGTPTPPVVPPPEAADPTPTAPDPAPVPPGSSLDLPPTQTPELLEQEGSGTLFLVQARASVQDGFDRVVWEYAGDGTPGWRVGYVDDPRRQGSGDPLDLVGDATLELMVRPVAWVPSADDPVPVPYPGVRRLVPSGTAAVREVDVELTFEADQQSFVGVRDELPFRVTLLRDPTRVVLDVAHTAP